MKMCALRIHPLKNLNRAPKPISNNLKILYNLHLISKEACSLNLDQVLSTYLAGKPHKIM